MYSSRSDRAPSTCRPAGSARHPGGSEGGGGGAICGRVHSRHSIPRSLRRVSSCASGDRERIQAVQAASQVALRADQSRRLVSSSRRANHGDVLRARSASALFASRCCFFDDWLQAWPPESSGCLLPSRVVLCSCPLPCCGLPAAMVESLGGEMRIDPSRRQVIETPSLRARRAAWRISCHWRALKEPRL